MLRRTLTSVMGILLISPAMLAQQPQKGLDTTTFVVMGEGLAAGVCDFSLSDVGQRSSFPALMARQMGALFPQPKIQPPGIGNVMGFSRLPVRLPAALQTTVRRPFPRFPQLIVHDKVPLWTQLEYAQQMRPTFALVELGFSEVLDAAVHGDLSRLPDIDSFRSSYEQIVATLRSTYADVLVTTVPDPLDTAYFNSPIWAAQLTRVPTYVVLGLYGLTVDDWITVPGLVEIGNQFLERRSAPLPSGSFIDATTADQIRAYVEQMNQEIRSVASSHGALLFDLHGLTRNFKDDGVTISGRRLSADFLGGLYSLDGYYPGATGQSLIANAILETLNAALGTSFSPISVEESLATDSVADYRISSGPEIPIQALAECIPELKMRSILHLKSQMEAPLRRSSPGRR
ncbi:MAG: hypothetical protein P8Y94_05325, partial [Acidobacteriota bacterium]